MITNEQKIYLDGLVNKMQQLDTSIIDLKFINLDEDIFIEENVFEKITTLVNLKINLSIRREWDTLYRPFINKLLNHKQQFDGYLILFANHLFFTQLSDKTKALFILKGTEFFREDIRFDYD